MKYSVIIGPHDHEAVLDLSLALFTKLQINDILYSLDCFPDMLDFKCQSDIHVILQKYLMKARLIFFFTKV